MWLRRAAAGCLLAWLSLLPFGGLIAGASGFTVRLYDYTGTATLNVNTASYVGSALTAFYVDFTDARWTHFSIYLWGNTNAVGQTVTLQVAEDVGPAFTPLSTSGNDLVVTNGSQTWLTTGRIAIAHGFTDLHRLALMMKGSNSTVDLLVQAIGVTFSDDSAGGTGPPGPTGPPGAPGATGAPCATPPAACDVDIVSFSGDALDLLRLAIFGGVVVGGFALLTLAWIAMSGLRR